MSKEKTPLTQTKGTFRLRGIVAGLSNDKSYKEGRIANGKKNAGKSYRSIRFPTRTSQNNSIYIELYGMERDKITVFKRDDQRSGGKSESKTIPFEKRHNIPADYHIIETSFQLEEDLEGKLLPVNLVQYDAVQYIKDHLKDGDSVYVSGNIEFSEYYNEKNKKNQTQVRYNIKSINKQTKPINFETDNFEEACSFEQEIVFIDKEIQGGRVYVTGRTIQYNGNYTDIQFVIDPKDDKEIAKTAKAFAKSLKYGDLVKVNGVLVNRVELEQVEDEISEGLFGNKKANGYGKRPIKNFISEYQIIGAENTYEPGKYIKTDFEQELFIDTSATTGRQFPIGDDDDDDLPF